MVALHKLQYVAFQERNGRHDEEECHEKWHEEWHDGMMRTDPTYKFWDMIVQVELRELAFVKARR